MKAEIGWRIFHFVLVIFRVVPPVKSPGAFAIFPMYVTRLVRRFILTHDEHIGLDEFFIEGDRLSPKTFDHLLVVLAKHGRNRIPLGGKLEKREQVVGLAEPVLVARFVSIYIRKFVFGGIGLQLEILERETFAV